MAEHRDYAKFHKTEEPSGQHFSLPGHSFHHMQGLAIEQVRNRDPFILKARETWLIKKFDCLLYFFKFYSLDQMNVSQLHIGCHMPPNSKLFLVNSAVNMDL